MSPILSPLISTCKPMRCIFSLPLTVQLQYSKYINVSKLQNTYISVPVSSKLKKMCHSSDNIVTERQKLYHP